MALWNPITRIAAAFRRPAPEETLVRLDQQRALIASLKGELYRLNRHAERVECENTRLRQRLRVVHLCGRRSPRRQTLR